MSSSSSSSGMTLTQVTRWGRQTIKFGSVGLVSAVILWMLFTSFVAYWKATHPPAPPPPTMGYGYLPTLVFPAQTALDKPKKYTLETANGRLPVFPDRTEVYFLPRPAASLLDDEKTNQVAKSLGFDGQPEIIDARTYRYTKTGALVATLTIDTRDHTFEIKTDYLNHPELLLDSDFPTQFGAVSDVKNFIDRAGLVNREIATSSGNVRYVKAVGTDLEPAVAVADADFIIVDINRVPKSENIPMYSEYDNQGSIRAILSGSKAQDKRLVYLRFSFHPSMPDQAETYPLRDITQAWNIVQAGEAYIVNKGIQDNATIREVSLGYYDSLRSQDYLQPVYVFKGDNNFMALVPALDPQVVAQNPSQVVTPGPSPTPGVK